MTRLLALALRFLVANGDTCRDISDAAWLACDGRSIETPEPMTDPHAVRDCFRKKVPNACWEVLKDE